MTDRAVLLDIGGVLELTPPTGWAGRWERRLGMPPGELDRRLADVWAAGEIGGMTTEQVEQRIAGLGLGADAVAGFLADLWHEYLGTANEPLIAYVRGLRGRCRRGLLSNSFVGAREREEAAYGFGSLAEEILYSHETGLVKPDPAAYELAARRLGVVPADCLFVDDLEVNCAAARAAGMAAVRFEENAATIARIESFLTPG